MVDAINRHRIWVDRSRAGVRARKAADPDHAAKARAYRKATLKSYNDRARMRRDTARKVREGIALSPCGVCGKPADQIDCGPAPRCRRCALVRIERPSAAVDGNLPWEQDRISRAIIAKYGALGRREIADLFGVTIECIRQIELKALSRFAEGLEAEGVNLEDLRDWLFRDERRHALDNDLGEL